MASCIREATADDIAAMFEIRISVIENAMTRQQLTDAGINAESVAAAITVHGRAWIAEEDGHAAGFAIADRRDGSIFALAVPQVIGLRR